MPLEDTIAAIATPIGEGGISIIRISGARALDVAAAMIRSKSGNPHNWPSHTIHLAEVCENDITLDQVMVSVMRAPASYTGENVVEINCHGGILVSKRLLDLALANGARLAQPGEFTKRAFLNGRIDLTQAEAVMDIIHSGSERALNAATMQLQGRLSKKLEPVREKLIEVLAHVEAHIDFPEEDIEPQTYGQLMVRCEEAEACLRQVKATAREGKILREGIRVAIVGRPNVGKSSLLNALLGEDRAIVMPTPGTTRDTIEEVVNIRGIPIRLIDTAGMRKATDAVEEEGIRRSEKAIAMADLVVHVLDGSENLTEEDFFVHQRLGPKKHLTVINKSDLGCLIDSSQLTDGKPVLMTSAKTGEGIESVKDVLEEIVWGGKIGERTSEVAINSRHENAIDRALRSLTKAKDGFRARRGLELISIDLRETLDAVGEITGQTTTEDLLDKIFSQFCIGK